MNDQVAVNLQGGSMMVFRVLLLAFILSSVSVVACDDPTKELINDYAGSLYTRVIGLEQALLTYQTSLEVSYTELSQLSENKKPLTESLVDPIQLSDEDYIASLETYFEEHESSLFAWDDPESSLLKAVNDCAQLKNKSTDIDELVSAHLEDVNLEDSIFTTLFDTFYLYSDFVVNEYESYFEALENGEFVPEAGYFLNLDLIANKISVGGQCAKDLFNLSFKNFCKLTQALEIDNLNCVSPPFEGVMTCN